jgi:hypothetical protein
VNTPESPKRRLSRRALVGLGAAAIVTTGSAAALNPAAWQTMLESRRGGLGLTPDEMIALRGQPDSESGPGQMIFKNLLGSAYVHDVPHDHPIGMIALNLVPWTWSEADAFARAHTFIPPDSRFLRAWKEPFGDTTRLYHSDWLERRYAELPAALQRDGEWNDGQPGELAITLGPELTFPNAIRHVMIFTGYVHYQGAKPL